MRATRPRRATAITLALMLPALWWSLSAIAQTVTLEIPIDTVVRDAEGTEHHLASETVPAEMVGLECTVTAVAHNQTSVHPGNDLIVSSGSDALVLEDVEGVSGGDTTGEGTLILADQVSVTLVMGPDGIFSAGMVVEATCQAPTTSTTTSSTTSSSTTSSSTTTAVGESTTTTTTLAPSTTIPDETTSTTSVLGTSTTTIPDETTSTTVLGTSTTTIGSDSTLPLTGMGGGGGGVAALAAIVAGAALVTISAWTKQGQHSTR